MDNLFHVQWHITEDCNLRCKHCYQETDKNPQSYDELLLVLDNIEALVEHESPANKISPKRITLTGGEPLVSPYFKDITREITKRGFILAILTNGTLITEETAHFLKELNPEFVQISLDGTEEVHNSIRGEGTFKKSLEALTLLDKLGVKTSVSFTVHKGNYLKFYELAKFLSEQNFKNVGIWSDRLIPFGNGQQMKTLTKKETEQFIKMMKQAKEDFKGKLRVGMLRALQFLESDLLTPYKCSAGNRFLTILPNGDVYPCRRMPILVGNTLKTPLVDLYTNDKFLKLMRRDDIYPVKCEGCTHKKTCNGGLKCLNFALEKTPFSKDVGCYFC